MLPPRRTPLAARLLFVLLAALALGFFLYQRLAPEPSSADIRVGWQTAWATQGQLAQILEQTNVLELAGLSATFQPYSYGGPLNDAAAAGHLDIVFTADQPAVALLARDGRWRIVARLMYNRTATYVPPSSTLKDMGDLRGRVVGVPFGAAAQRVAYAEMLRRSLDPLSDVKVRNLDIYEQASVIETETTGKWGEYDALVGFDPFFALFQERSLAKPIHEGNVVALVLMSADVLENRPVIARRFLRAYAAAWLYYATHVKDANALYRLKWPLKLELTDSVLAKSAAPEPNLHARHYRDLALGLSDEDRGRLQEAADFGPKYKLAKAQVSVASYIDLAPLTDVLSKVDDLLDIERIHVR